VSYMGPGLPDDAFIETAEPLARDVLCRHCGYNLRGHRPSQRCSECGTPVRDSLRPDELQYADPDWLDKLRLGMTLILWSIVGGFLLGFVGAILASSANSPVVLVLAYLFSAVLQTYGVFLLTTQEPRIALTEDPVTLRRAIRVCAIVMLVGGAIQNVLPLGPTVPLVVAIGLLKTVANVIVLFGQFVFLRRFARRIPDDRLARSTTIVMWGGASVFVLAMILAAVAGATTAAGGTGFAGGGFPVASVCVVSLVAIVMGIWYLILLMRYRRAFATAAEFARENATPHFEARAIPPADDRPLG